MFHGSAGEFVCYCKDSYTLVFFVYYESRVKGSPHNHQGERTEVITGGVLGGRETFLNGPKRGEKRK